MACVCRLYSAVYGGSERLPELSDNGTLDCVPDTLRDGARVQPGRAENPGGSCDRQPVGQDDRETSRRWMTPGRRSSRRPVADVEGLAITANVREAFGADRRGAPA